MSEARVREIREPQPELIQDMIILEKEAFGAGGLDEWTLPVVIAYGRVFLLEKGQKICGLAALIRNWSDPHLAYLLTFSIVNNERGQGLGKEFLSEIIDRLRKESFTRIRATVSPGNSAARLLYQGRGFREVFFLRDYYGSDEDRLLVELQLGETK